MQKAVIIAKIYKVKKESLMFYFLKPKLIRFTHKKAQTNKIKIKQNKKSWIAVILKI